jgi:hypothetical protein
MIANPGSFLDILAEKGVVRFFPVNPGDNIRSFHGSPFLSIHQPSSETDVKK